MENKEKIEEKEKSKEKTLKKKKEVNKKESCKCQGLEEENAKLQDKVLRLTAEIQNIKRRSDEEISKLCKYDGETLIVKLLSVLDNFERAILLDDRDLTYELSQFLSGFKMIYTSLIGTLNDLEVKEIDCQGVEFDPTKMEAVLTSKDENLPAGVVIEVLQKGYTYKDKVIRVAMVKVNE